MPFCLKFSYTHQFYLIYREIPGLKIWLQFHFVYLSRTSKKFSPPDRCTLCWFSEFSTETSTWFHKSYHNPHLCFKFSIYLSYFRSLKIIRLGEKLLLKTFSKFLYKLLLARDTYLPSIKFLLAYWAFKTSFFFLHLSFFLSKYIRNTNIPQNQPGGKGEHCQDADYGYTTLLTTVFPMHLAGYTNRPGDIIKNILDLMK